MSLKKKKTSKRLYSIWEEQNLISILSDMETKFLLFYHRWKEKLQFSEFLDGLVIHGHLFLWVVDIFLASHLHIWNFFKKSRNNYVKKKNWKMSEKKSLTLLIKNKQIPPTYMDTIFGKILTSLLEQARIRNLT